MATKKQKRAIAEAKRAEFEAQLKAEGLAALKRDREEWARKDAKIKETAHEINRHHNAILMESMWSGAQRVEKIEETSTKTDEIKVLDQILAAAQVAAYNKYMKGFLNA